jgi:hypothetical protein
MVRGRGRAVVGRVGHLLVGLAAGLLPGLVVAVPAAVVAVAVRARRRIVAEQVLEDPPELLHKKGL